MIPCVYRGSPQGREIEGLPVYDCRQFEHCTEERINGTPGCKGCKKYLITSQPNFPEKWEDPLVILDRSRKPTTALRTHILGGRAAFLLCGGPSAKDLPLERLSQRGAWTMAVNNVAGWERVRPQAFVCADPPLKFHDTIWRDPGIMKFIPTVKLKHHGKGDLRYKVEGGFARLEGGTSNQPNVWGYERRGWMKPDDSFFMEPSTAWGNLNEGVTKTGLAKTVCTMLIGIRLMYYLGCRRLFLLGADFWMKETYGYSFPQRRSADDARKNNEQFGIVNSWLCQMVKDGVFARFGLEVYNCFADSGLRAFQYVPFEKALEIACQGISQSPDLSGWYDDKTITK